jgi:hypothetical protein
LNRGRLRNHLVLTGARFGLYRNVENPFDESLDSNSEGGGQRDHAGSQQSHRIDGDREHTRPRDTAEVEGLHDERVEPREAARRTTHTNQLRAHLDVRRERQVVGYPARQTVCYGHQPDLGLLERDPDRRRRKRLDGQSRPLAQLHPFAPQRDQRVPRADRADGDTDARAFPGQSDDLPGRTAQP